MKILFLPKALWYRVSHRIHALPRGPFVWGLSLLVCTFFAAGFLYYDWRVFSMVRKGEFAADKTPPAVLPSDFNVKEFEAILEFYKSKQTKYEDLKDNPPTFFDPSS